MYVKTHIFNSRSSLEKYNIYDSLRTSDSCVLIIERTGILWTQTSTNKDICFYIRVNFKKKKKEKICLCETTKAADIPVLWAVQLD